jgi:hypothetical protein
MGAEAGALRLLLLVVFQEEDDVVDVHAHDHYHNAHQRLEVVVEADGGVFL